MKFIASISLVCAVLYQSQSVQAFTIINQTDSKKVLIIEEARRPSSVSSGTVNAPFPDSSKPHRINVPAKEVVTLDLAAPCPGLLVSVEDVVKKGSKKKTTTAIMSYEVYSYDVLIDNNWGLVIHKPIENPDFGSPLSPDYFSREMLWQETVEQGYGIQFLHPNWLEKVTSLEVLPEELN